MATEEGQLTLKDGTKLYTKTWKTEGLPKARLAFIHGFSDHCNAYGMLFPHLASLGIQTHSFDQRGWGRSVLKPSQKGDTGSTSLVLADITEFLQTLLPVKDGIPLFLMGHSMGGGEVAYYMTLGPADVLAQIRGFLLESPFIDFHPSSKPNQITVVLGRLASKVLPHHQLYNPLNPKLLSRDPEVQKAVVDDELCHDTGTLEGLAGLLDRAGNLSSGKIIAKEGIGEDGRTRLWDSHGTDDGVCSYPASKKWFDMLQIEDKELKSYDGWYHKLHAEPGELKVEFANDVANWILARSGDLSSLPKSKL